MYVELSFSNSCLKSSLLPAKEPVLYDAIARAGSNRRRHKIGRGAHEAAAAAGANGFDLAAAARCGIRWRHKRSGTIGPARYYVRRRRRRRGGGGGTRQGLVVIAWIWTGVVGLAVVRFGLGMNKELPRGDRRDGTTGSATARASARR